MPRTVQPYDEDFKKQALELLLSSQKPISHVARELGISVETLRDWKKRAMMHLPHEAVIPPPRDESLEELRRVNRQMAEQLALKTRACEILKKAIAICSELPGINTTIR